MMNTFIQLTLAMLWLRVSFALRDEQDEGDLDTLRSGVDATANQTYCILEPPEETKYPFKYSIPMKGSGCIQCSPARVFEHVKLMFGAEECIPGKSKSALCEPFEDSTEKHCACHVNDVMKIAWPMVKSNRRSCSTEGCFDFFKLNQEKAAKEALRKERTDVPEGCDGKLNDPRCDVKLVAEFSPDIFRSSPDNCNSCKKALAASDQETLDRMQCNGIAPVLGLAAMKASKDTVINKQGDQSPSRRSGLKHSDSIIVEDTKSGTLGFDQFKVVKEIQVAPSVDVAPIDLTTIEDVHVEDEEVRINFANDAAEQVELGVQNVVLRDSQSFDEDRAKGIITTVKLVPGNGGIVFNYGTWQLKDGAKFLEGPFNLVLASLVKKVCPPRSNFFKLCVNVGSMVAAEALPEGFLTNRAATVRSHVERGGWKPEFFGQAYGWPSAPDRYGAVIVKFYRSYDEWMQGTCDASDMERFDKQDADREMIKRFGGRDGGMAN